MNLQETFKKYNDDFLKFEKIEYPRHPVPDICAFLMLADLDLLARASGGPSAGKAMDVVASAAHDEIWLNADVERLSERGNEETIRDLVRCGVRYDSQYDSLAMFV